DVEMRHLIENGHYNLEVSGAYPREFDINGKPVPGGGHVFRGHVKGSGDFTSGDNWEYGFDATRTSDDTYLRRYNFGHYEDILKSEAFADWIKDRDYFQTKLLSFQDLRATVDPATQPVVAPLIDAGKTYRLSDDYN